MNKVCVLVGEGKSEKAFLSSLILNKKGFEIAYSKNAIVYQSTKDRNLFWIFPIPSYGQAHKGGRAVLESEETYIVARSKILGHRWLFGDYPELHYRIFTDSDSDDETMLKAREVRIRDAITRSKTSPKSLKVFYAHREIESWFIAGLNGDTFPERMFEGKKIKKELLSRDPDSIIDPKKELDNALSLEISGDRIRIATDFGEYIDLTAAKSRSASFKAFYDTFDADSLF